MKATIEQTGFKAVEFMRKVRVELSKLYQQDKDQFHDELKKTTAEFLARRAKVAQRITRS